MFVLVWLMDLVLFSLLMDLVLFSLLMYLVLFSLLMYLVLFSLLMDLVLFSLVDGLIQGEGIHEGRLTGFMSTAESRVRIPWRGGAIRSTLN